MNHYLTTIYSTIKDTNIVILLKEFEEDTKAFFNDRTIQISVDEFIKFSNKIPLDVLVQDPSGLLQIASLTNTIYLRLSEFEHSDKLIILKQAFQDSLAKQVSLIVEKSKSQLIELGSFLKTIANLCLEIEVASIYILELPIGNSIPSFLLKKILLFKGKESDIITISINRNDSKPRGITRKQLIKTAIEKLDLDNSIVIYLDEWITGSNFNNILTILSKIPGLNFLPGAFLTHESKEHDRYSQYKMKFDQLCNKAGLNSEKLTIELPTLNYTIVSEQKFIWTEFDRLAGYRKIEFLGSIISTFFAVGEALLDDSQLLNAILEEAILEHTTLKPDIEIAQELKAQILKSFQYFNSTFVSDLEENISSIDIYTSAGFDLEIETAKVLSLFEKTKGYDDSKLAINIIGYYMKNKIISPNSRYYYKGHVPLCLALEGVERLLSELFITEIEKLVLD